MAYGAILGQNPNLSAYAKKEGLPVNDIRTYPVRDGQSISAGDVVNVGAASDGAPETVYKDVVAQDNVENVFRGTGGAVNATDVCKLNDDYSVIAYTQSEGNWSQVVLVQNQTGQAIENSVANFQSTAVSSVSLARLDDSHFVVQFQLGNGLYAKIGTVSGNSITLGNDRVIDQPLSNTDRNNAILSLSQSFALSIYNSSGIQVKFLTISGNQISTVSAAYSLPSNTGANYISACRLPDEGGNKRVCICFSDTGDGNKGKAVIATINSSNAVTFGDVVTVRDESIVNTNCAYVDGIIYFYTGSCLYALSENLSVLGNQTIIGVSSQSTNGLIGLNNRVVVLNGVSGNGGATSARWDGGAIEYGEPYKFNGSNTANYISCAAISDNEILLAYADKGNSNYGTTTILEVNGNQIAGSFIDSSQDAIALADGTGGQSIPVGFGGYCECPEVTEGQQITSDGVSAFSPLDGWLSITDYRSKQVPVTGSFTATRSLQTINLGFKPSMVICYSSSNNAKNVIGNTSSSSTYGPIPRILSNAYVYTDASGIVENGFTFAASSSVTVYYIAWR